MPIYEDDCPRCGRFDALQRMSSPALEVHDVCGSRVTKLVSAFAFRGSGLHATDHGSRGEEEQAAAGGGCGQGACASGGCAAAGA